MSIARTTLAAVTLSLAACGRGPEDRVDRQSSSVAHAAIAQAERAAPPPALGAPPPAPSADAIPPCDGRGKDCGACEGKQEPAPTVATTREGVALGDAPTLGPRDAAVTIVIFSDFECPFCAKVEPRIMALAERYPGAVRLVFKNQPLPMHERARLAAKAALAADEQGKFWEYHRTLFAGRALDRDALERTARELGLNLSRFRTALDGDALERRLAADVVESHRLGVKGTPTFFVNGRRIVGAQPTEVFAAAIDEELALTR